MMTRTAKEQEVGAIRERIKKSKAAFLVDFKGMNVSQVTDLRKKLFPVESEMRVVRNTLAKRAFLDFPEINEAISGSLKGTNAIVFAYGDVTALAKTLTQFSKDVEFLQLKKGVMDGKVMDESKIQFLSTLPTKEVLRAQFLGVLQAPASQFVRVLMEGPASLVRVMKLKSEQVEN